MARGMQRALTDPFIADAVKQTPWLVAVIETGHAMPSADDPLGMKVQIALVDKSGKQHRFTLPDKPNAADLGLLILDVEEKNPSLAQASAPNVTAIKPKGNPDVADKLRQIADKIEAGELTEVIVVANAPERNSWYHYQHFDDQVRLIGACEFAKAAIFEAALRG